MFRTIVAAFVAAGSLAAPAAVADEPIYECRWVGFQHDVITGSSYQGVLVGYAVHEGSGSFNCRMTVNGITHTQTGESSGTGLVTTARDVSFAADDTDVVQVCADFTSPHGSRTTCVTQGTNRLPPQVVYDTLDSAVDQVSATVDPPLCSFLRMVADDYGPVDIDADGDISVGNASYDCPPYDD